MDIFLIWDHSFCMYAKFSEKLTFLTPIRILTYAYQGVRNLSFSENFANVLNEWSLFVIILPYLSVQSFTCNSKPNNMSGVKLIYYGICLRKRNATTVIPPAMSYFCPNCEPTYSFIFSLDTSIPINSIVQYVVFFFALFWYFKWIDKDFQNFRTFVFHRAWKQN